ncbi:MAG: endonuclease domain-containing protein [Nitrospirae bacterium]|nr:endonuclease domain-containing protein [Nitrospirota bacterium]
MSDLKKILMQTAKDLRNNPTDAERYLWEQLGNKRLDGHKFRKQQRIGNFIVDFACMEKKLLIELDGEVHLTQKEKDAKRDQWLECEGYKVIRFWNSELHNNLEGVLEEIRKHLDSPTP